MRFSMTCELKPGRISVPVISLRASWVGLACGAMPRLFALAAILLALSACSSGKSGNQAPPPPEVGVIKAVAQPVTVYEEYVAQTEAVDTVEIRARVGGILERQAYVDGAKVKKGDPLFVIDQQPYIAALAQANEPMKAEAMSHTSSAVELRSDMRQLWEEHIVYTRNFIISALADLGDTDKIAERLLRNQDDIGNAVKPFYGEEAGKKLASLLRDHILIAADIVKAAKAGNNDGVASGEKRWHANADEISVFLSGANPNWPKPVLTDMLYKHLDFTTTEVVSRIKKDWPADI